VKIAHLFAAIEPTGGDRISYHHVNGLRKLGHIVDVYYADIFENYWKDCEFMSPEAQEYMFKYDPVVLDAPVNNYNSMFSKYDMVVSNGLFGSNNASKIDHPLKIWFCQNLDKYVFPHVSQKDKSHIDNLYRTQRNYMAYSPHLLQLIEHYYGKGINSILCTNGITYRKFEPYRKVGNGNSKRVCFMSAYNGVLKRSKFADQVFEELNSRGFTTVEINAHKKGLIHSQEFYKNPDFDSKCKIIAGCDIMLHPSIFETWSLVTMESMALGVPVVGYDSKGVSLFAKDDRDIVFVYHFDVNLFCDAIEDLINDKEHYQNIQEGGIKTSSQYDWDDIMPEIESSYLNWLE